jgi:hypothetical protein
MRGVAAAGATFMWAGDSGGRTVHESRNRVDAVRNRVGVIV